MINAKMFEGFESSPAPSNHLWMVAGDQAGAWGGAGPGVGVWDAAVGVRVVLGVLGVVLTVVGGGGNLLVVLVVWRCPAMRSAINLMLAAMALGDAVMLLLLLPMDVVALSYGAWVLSTPICHAHTFMLTTLQVLSGASLAIICIDRHAILVRHKERLTPRIILVLVASVAALGLAAALPPVLGLGTYTQTPMPPLLTHCEWRPGQEGSPRDLLYAYFVFLVIFLVPALTMTICLAAVGCTLKHNAARVHSVTLYHPPMDGGTPGMVLATTMPSTYTDTASGTSIRIGGTTGMPRDQTSKLQLSQKWIARWRSAMTRIQSAKGKIKVGGASLRKTVRESQETIITDGITTQDNKETPSVVSQSSLTPNSPTPQINLDLSHKTQTLTTVAYLGVVFVVCRMPLHVFQLMYALCSSPSLASYPWLLFLAYLQPAMNPLLYTSIQRFRSAVGEVFPWMRGALPGLCGRIGWKRCSNPSAIYVINKSELDHGP